MIKVTNISFGQLKDHLNLTIWQPNKRIQLFKNSFDLNELRQRPRDQFELHPTAPLDTEKYSKRSELLEKNLANLRALRKQVTQLQLLYNSIKEKKPKSENTSLWKNWISGQFGLKSAEFGVELVHRKAQKKLENLKKELQIYERSLAPHLQKEEQEEKKVREELRVRENLESLSEKQSLQMIQKELKQIEDALEGRVDTSDLPTGFVETLNPQRENSDTKKQIELANELHQRNLRGLPTWKQKP